MDTENSCVVQECLMAGMTGFQLGSYFWRENLINKLKIDNQHHALKLSAKNPTYDDELLNYSRILIVVE